MRKRIEDALRRRAEVEAHNITVEVGSNGAFTLDGKVGNWDERRAAEHAAWSAPGVRLVEDRITIG